MATKSSIMDTNSYSDDYSSLLSNTTRDMINRREKWMGGAYRLFYRKPVNLVRGQGQYLWDAVGINIWTCTTMWQESVIAILLWSRQLQSR